MKGNNSVNSRQLPLINRVSFRIPLWVRNLFIQPSGGNPILYLSLIPKICVIGGPFLKKRTQFSNLQNHSKSFMQNKFSVGTAHPTQEKQTHFFLKTED